jgi:hypothetical protein
MKLNQKGMSVGKVKVIRGVLVRRCVALFVGLAVSEVFAGQTQVEFYPAAPGARLDSRFELTVEGEPRPLEFYRNAIQRQRHFMDTSRIRFASDGPVEVELRVKDGAVANARLRALGRDIEYARSGSNLSFRLPGPGHYYLQLPALAEPYGTCTVLFWVDDLQKRNATHIRPDAPGVTNVKTAGVNSDPTKDQTAAIQTLLDKGGVVYFPAGIYRAGTLCLRSDTTLYMAAGSMLKAVDDESALATEFIAIYNVRNVKVLGFGTIDANGRVAYGHNVHNVNITAGKNVLFEDVLFQNSNSWAIHIRKSGHFTARNVKVFSGKDGFDPDSSRDVLIDSVFVVSIDDAVAVKNRFPDDPDGRVTERVKVRDSIVSSTKSALKIGTETRGPVRDIDFENCDIYDGERGIVLYARDGGPVERVTWRDIRMSMIDWTLEKNSGRLFHLTIDYRSKNSRVSTPVRDCLIENIKANCIYPSELAGLPDAPLDGLVMRNIELAVNPPRDQKPHYLFEPLSNVSVPVQGLKVDWQGNKHLWSGISSTRGMTILPWTGGQRRP